MRKHRADTERIAKLTEQLGIEYTWMDKLIHPFMWLWVRLEETWTNLHYRCQRFRKGYSDLDVWEMRDWFIRSAKPMLRELSVKTYNHPEELSEDQWREVLLEMANLLDIMDIWDDAAARKQASLASEEESADAVQKISAEKEKAKDRFFLLFNKWFYDLWY